MQVRKICDNCAITDTYQKEENICKTCSHAGLQPSENFEYAYGTNNLNKQVRELLADELAKVDAEIEKFEQGWYRTWNGTGPTQLDWETPKDYSGWLEVFKNG